MLHNEWQREHRMARKDSSNFWTDVWRVFEVGDRNWMFFFHCRNCRSSFPRFELDVRIDVGHRAICCRRDSYLIRFVPKGKKCVVCSKEFPDPFNKDFERGIQTVSL